MALKFRITKAQFEKLSDEIKEHYKADGDDHYKADVTGLDTPDALRRSKERSDARVAELEAEAEELNTKVTTLETDNAKLKTGQTKEGRDVTRLQTKYDRDMASKDAEIDKAKGFVEKALVMSNAEAIAKEISTVPKLLVNELKSRMKVDFTGEEPVLQILGKDGKPTRN
jgi:serine/threonine protein kinase HipA of HipAB toxin-antitoxin module